MRIRPLVKSARSVGIFVEPICCRGFMDKLFSLNAAIKGLSDDELVICTDGYDCLYLEDQETILKRFAEFGREIVFGGQTEFDHHIKAAVETAVAQSGTGDYRILNSGIIAGRSGALRHMLDVVCGWDLRLLADQFVHERAGIGYFNDQTVCGRYFALNPHEIAIDQRGRLSWTSAYEENYVDSLLAKHPFVLVNPRTLERPCIFHLPGVHGSETYLQYLNAFLALGHDISPEDVQIVRLEKLAGTDGPRKKAAKRFLKMISAKAGYRKAKYGQYVDVYKRKVMVLLSKCKRRLFPPSEESQVRLNGTQFR